MCSRCVRFTREISGTAELQVVGRGTHEEIDIFPGLPCNNKLAGNVVDLCPVGALCSKDFLYKQRVWWLQSKSSVCPGCSTGCSIHVDQNEDRVYRLRPRVNPQAQGHFICDEGRFGWKYVHSEQRLRFPEQRVDGRIVSRDWDTILPTVRSALTGAVQKAPQRVAAVLSPWMTVEEAYLLANNLKGLSPLVTLALGHVRHEGEDDTYPKDVHGRPAQPVKFTIRAEKCPNRRGVELVLEHFCGTVVPFGDVLGRAAARELDVLYLVGGDPQGWIGEDQIESLRRVGVVIVQDILQTSASRAAAYTLPGGSFAERDGTFVNHAGLAQEIHRSIRGPGESRPDGRILWELSGRKGLFNASVVRKEIAEHVPAFAGFASGSLREQGVLIDEGQTSQGIV
jgi:NADH-quinone oxidoreductase subunit G